MIVFNASFSKFVNSLHLSAAFQLQIGYLNVGLLNLGAACAALLVLVGPSASLTARIATFMASIATSAVDYIMLCSAAISIVCTLL